MTQSDRKNTTRAGAKRTNDVMVSGPQVDVDGIEDTEEGETP